MNTLTNQQEIRAYIKENPVMVLGTVGKNNEPYGAAVYVCSTTPDQLYFITKNQTQKYKNLLENPKVSVVIVNSTENSTLQATGVVKVESDPQVIELVMGKMAEIYARAVDWLPPIAKIRSGPYEVVGIKLTSARLANYKGAPAGDKRIFKEA